jgi:eukaryotic-like serine/threonine-protein kinase
VAESPDFRRRIGQVIADRYELLDLIGIGGQGAVYRARDRQDESMVAVKMLFARDADTAERGFREAEVMSQLSDTAAVRALSRVRAEDGALGIVMELLHGSDLAALLERREAEGIKANREWLEPTFEPIVHTLEAAHARGIVHRDLKPSNVFVLDGGGVRLLDFGFAKLLRAVPITAAQFVAGSPSYLAPEIWLNGSSYADPLVDVYALGVVLFRVLGGKLPFEGSMMDLMRAATQAPRPSLRALRPDLDQDIDAWVEEVLAIKPQDRFARPTSAWRALLTCF